MKLGYQTDLQKIAMEKPLLTNPEIIPENSVFEYALGDVFPVFETLLSDITNKDIGLVHEWRYYNDGKAWLCKVQYKKKTVFWLSIWESCFKISFFFMERHLDGFFDLPIDPSVKDQLNLIKPTGKIIPVVLTIRHMEQLDDVRRIIDFKKKLL